MEITEITVMWTAIDLWRQGRLHETATLKPRPLTPQSWMYCIRPMGCELSCYMYSGWPQERSLFNKHSYIEAEGREPVVTRRAMFHFKPRTVRKTKERSIQRLQLARYKERCFLFVVHTECARKLVDLKLGSTRCCVLSTLVTVFG